MNIYLIICFSWLFFLTFLVIKIRNHYYSLISKTRKERLDEILDELLKENKKLTNEINLIKKELEKEINNSKFYLQKIGLVRFNPFERLAGEQSFVVVFLDREDNGIILNFIYTREGLRVYSKKVKNGKGDQYQLSEEEKKAIEKAVINY